MSLPRIVSLALVVGGAACAVGAVALLAGFAWSLLLLGVLLVVAGLFLVDVA